MAATSARPAMTHTQLRSPSTQGPIVLHASNPRQEPIQSHALTRWEIRRSWAQAMRQLNTVLRPPEDSSRVINHRPLICPRLLRTQIITSSESAWTVDRGRREAAAIVTKQDDRLLVLVGPCSIHDPDAAVEFAQKIKPVADRLSPELCIIMRAYLEKPRTTVGWKGLLNDPDLDGSCNMEKGIHISRQLYADLTHLGVPIASELLDLSSPAYLSDFISVGAIGARTTESQPHRELASAMPFPVGFKNSTDGSVTQAINSLISAGTGHTFCGPTDNSTSRIISSSGNADCFLILRGGSSGPNYHLQDVQQAQRQLSQSQCPNGIMIDCSHGNSNKDFRRQPIVVDEVCNQVASGEHSVIGVMIESNLYGGKQNIPPEGRAGLQKGVSITDGCIGLEDTVGCLERLAAAVRRRRCNRV
ncbi:3-deoxy-7-phosphoheptulonate synthase [Aspergillus udagawae]|uniref:3-deoxy-7-phosphoheptulonate synthase n=1 Tax=Aspergillus udagawae TaxID=91492 RepID=A0A8E0V544_9EURO|nr:3-deoxy-7-phosphoheptulonate synthase [Aspergillus udagawae]GIC94405.1 3-deoxy-7-phosphoheptulonate synthase [Aspergillus udagawae]